MANTVIGASVEVQYESVGQMRKAIKEATSDLIAMQEQFGKTSPQAMAAAQKIAELKDRIQDAKEQADLFDPGNKFKAFSNAASQVAAGFSAVQGAMALVGVESDDLQKQLVKVQGAMALSQGLSQLGELGKAFDELKIVGVRAFNALKGAIGSTGIGLLVIAAGTIVAYWDDIKAAVTGYNAELDKANRKNQENLKTLDFEIQKIEKSRDTRKAQGQTEQQINKLLLDRYIKQAEIEANSLKNLKAQRELQIAAAQRNQNIVRNITRFAIEAQAAVYRIIGGPLDLLIITANKVSEVLGFGKITTFSINEEITKMSKGLSEAAAQKLFDPKEVDENINKAELAALEAQNKVDQLRTEMNASQNKSDKKNNADKEKIDQDELRRKQEAAELEKKINEDLAKSKLDERNKELFDLKKTYDEQKKILEDNGKSTAALTELYKSQEFAINKKYDDEEKKRQDELRLQKEKLKEEELKKQKEKSDKDIQRLDEEFKNQEFNLEKQRSILDKQALIFKNQLDQKLITEEEYNTKIKGLAKERTTIAEKEAAARIQLARGIGDALGALSDIVGKETAAGKALAIAQATINTFLGITEVWKAKSVLPEPFNTASKIAATITTAAGGFGAVRGILKTKVPGRASGGGNVPSMPSIGGAAPLTPGLGATATAQALNAEAINNLGNTALRAYVMNSDIQNNSQRNAYLQRNARIG